MKQQPQVGPRCRRWLGVGTLSALLWTLSPALWAQSAAGLAESEQRAAPAPLAAGPKQAGSPPWLTLTLAGLGTASLITAITAWRVREGYAARWNSQACVRTGQTRIQVCPYDYAGGQDSETIVWISGATAVASLTGAVTSWMLQDPEHPAPASARVTCGVAGLGAACSGAF